MEEKIRVSRTIIEELKTFRRRHPYEMLKVHAHFPYNTRWSLCGRLLWGYNDAGNRPVNCYTCLKAIERVEENEYNAAILALHR